MDFTFIIGNLAAVLTTVSFLPQALKTIRTKDTKGLSLPMYVLFVSGVGLWLLYGMLNNQMPIIAGNLITFILAGTILLFMVKGLLSRK
ncbi:hypothetical protein BFP77_12995 [Maribacter sp. 4U21]|uniref:SemiSWEET transporter n=1 Tax=Maribacter sp. 4U21 TaxID=1889779 RepID=UPI000C14DF0C|nr:SemiSWEET transporter [Maribacter sp. 4U21]PIB27280.1 hypothetical protein BFP77_12995 [Maribacter sp. 4U21]